MKKYYFIIFILFFISTIILFTPKEISIAETQYLNNENIEDELNDYIDKTLNEINWTTLEEFLETNADDDFLISSSLLSTIKKILSGDFTLNSSNFLEYLFRILISGIKKFFPVLSGVAVISILSGLVSKSKTNLLNETTGNLINYFFFSTILLLLISSVYELLTSAKKVILSIKTLTNLTMPTLLTLMTATGAKISTKVYSPSIMLLSSGVTEIVTNIVLPTFTFCLIFSIISNLSSEIKLQQLSAFFKNISSWVLGITFTIFTGFLAIQGLTASTIDGVSIRAAKFATKTYIPILGGYLADGFDLVLTSCILIKNSFGLIVLLILLAIIMSPILKIIIFNITLNLISAITEPIADKMIIGFLVDLRKIISILLVSVIAVTFMLFILIMMIIFSANIY